VNATLANLFETLSTQYPAGAMIKTYYTLFHTLDIVQYKISYHIFNLLTLADRVSEVISYVEYDLSSGVGPWSYASAEIQAFFAHPQGPFM